MGRKKDLALQEAYKQASKQRRHRVTAAGVICLAGAIGLSVYLNHRQPTIKAGALEHQERTPVLSSEPRTTDNASHLPTERYHAPSSDTPRKVSRMPVIPDGVPITVVDARSQLDSLVINESALEALTGPKARAHLRSADLHGLEDVVAIEARVKEYGPTTHRFLETAPPALESIQAEASAFTAYANQQFKNLGIPVPKLTLATRDSPMRASLKLEEANASPQVIYLVKHMYDPIKTDYVVTDSKGTQVFYGCDAELDLGGHVRRDANHTERGGGSIRVEVRSQPIVVMWHNDKAALLNTILSEQLHSRLGLYPSVTAYENAMRYITEHGLGRERHNEILRVSTSRSNVFNEAVVHGITNHLSMKKFGLPAERFPLFYAGVPLVMSQCEERSPQVVLMEYIMSPDTLRDRIGLPSLEKTLDK